MLNLATTPARMNFESNLARDRFTKEIPIAVKQQQTPQMILKNILAGIAAIDRNMVNIIIVFIALRCDFDIDLSMNVLVKQRQFIIFYYLFEF